MYVHVFYMYVHVFYMYVHVFYMYVHVFYMYVHVCTCTCTYGHVCTYTCIICYPFMSLSEVQSLYAIRYILSGYSCFQIGEQLVVCDLCLVSQD